jgi:hypothetical protein
MTHLDPATVEECDRLKTRIAGPLPQQTVSGKPIDAFRLIVSQAERDLLLSAIRSLTAVREIQSSDGGVVLPPKDFARVYSAITAAKDVLRGHAKIDYDADNHPQPNFAFEVEQQCKEALNVLDECNEGFQSRCDGPSEAIDAHKAHALAWHRQIVEAGGSESVAHQAVTLAALNGLFDHIKSDPVVRQDCAPAETADKNCVTLPNGDCIGKGCMHDDSSHPVAGLTEETPLDVLNGIRDALESRGYVHMANGRDIGNLIDELRRLTSSPVSEEELGNAIRQNCIIALWQDDADALARALLSQFSIGRK